MPDKLAKLQKLIEIADEGLTREEFLAGFKLAVDFIKKAEENLTKLTEKHLEQADNRRSEMEKLYKDTVRQIKEDNHIPNLRKWALEHVEKMYQQSDIDGQVAEKLGQVEAKISELDALELPDPQAIAQEAASIAREELKSHIPVIEDIEKDLPKLGPEIRNALELLQGDERLDMKAIKGLREALDGLRGVLQSKNFVSHGSGNTTGGRMVKLYDLSSSLDGTTKVFSLPAMWRIISVQSSSFPNAFRPTTDYVHNASAHTITFTNEITAATTLAAGQTLTIIYSE